MFFLIVIVTLLLIESVYFFIAKRFNIIDKPNERSLHSIITIRGGGIIFVVSVLLYSIYSNFQYPIFIFGLLAVATISFLDDVFTLPNRYRLPFQFLAVIYELAQDHLFVVHHCRFLL